MIEMGGCLCAMLFSTSYARNSCHCWLQIDLCVACKQFQQMAVNPGHIMRQKNRARKIDGKKIFLAVFFSYTMMALQLHFSVGMIHLEV